MQIATAVHIKLDQAIQPPLCYLEYRRKEPSIEISYPIRIIPHNLQDEKGAENMCPALKPSAE